MEITVVIGDETLEEPVRKAVGAAVNQVVRDVVNNKLLQFKGPLEVAVQKYLDSHLSDDKIRSILDKEVALTLADRIRELD